MGKIPSTKKDSFFIGKKRKNFESPTQRQKFVKKPYSVDDQTTSSSSGSFFIKSTEKSQKSDTKTPDKPKKQFDKKKWRLQKYSKKYKLEQWEERRKKNLLHEYYKQVENEPKFNVQKIYEKYADDEEDNDNENNLNRIGLPESTTENPDDTINTLEQSSSSQEKPIKSTVKQKIKKHAQDEFKRKQEEKKLKKEEIEKKKAEKAEALEAYKRKKFERFKKLNKKTKKGQPVMKYRMEMLLEQIQKSTQ